MLHSGDILRSLLSNGFDFYTGVPCSMFKYLLNCVINKDENKLRYIATTEEGQAVGVGVGGILSGRRVVVFSQNSGLGNMVNPLTSLVNLYKIPLLMILSLRGKSRKDGLEHRFMYRITTSLLDLLKIKWSVFPTSLDGWKKTIKKAVTYMNKFSLPYALLMENNNFHPVKSNEGFIHRDIVSVLPKNWRSPCFYRKKSQLTTREALEGIISSITEKDVIISTTGKISRELYALRPPCPTFYMLGSMGYASAIGLGVALSKPDKRVIVIDGDGALLMKMSNLATIGYYHPNSFVHIVIDNGGYETTGGQVCVSRGVDLSIVAKSCGYNNVYSVAAAKDIKYLLKDKGVFCGTTFIRVKTVISKGRVGRIDVEPLEIKRRFMQYVNAY